MITAIEARERLLSSTLILETIFKNIETDIIKACDNGERSVILIGIKYEPLLLCNDYHSLKPQPSTIQKTVMNTMQSFGYMINFNLLGEVYKCKGVSDNNHKLTATYGITISW